MLKYQLHCLVDLNCLRFDMLMWIHSHRSYLLMDIPIDQSFHSLYGCYNLWNKVEFKCKITNYHGAATFILKHCNNTKLHTKSILFQFYTKSIKVIFQFINGIIKNKGCLSIKKKHISCCDSQAILFRILVQCYNIRETIFD